MWIRLLNIPIYAFHGAYAHEMEFGGKFELDVEIEADLQRAAVDDLLSETIDYAKVLKCVVQFSQAERFKLLETWAHHLALEVCKEFPKTEQCNIRIRKTGGAVGGLVESVEVEHRYTNAEHGR